MNFENLISGNVRLIHLIVSFLAIGFGTLVLMTPKGIKRHKKLGYCYTGSMVILLVTAFMLYNLFGNFGIFHWAAVVSTLTLIGGMVPMVLKKPASHVSLHFNFMYWSVFGLYGAFMAEVLTRIPDLYEALGGPSPAVFYNLVGVAVFITMGIGYFIMAKKKKEWNEFDKSVVK